VEEFFLPGETYEGVAIDPASPLLGVVDSGPVVNGLALPVPAAAELPLEELVGTEDPGNGIVDGLASARFGCPEFPWLVDAASVGELERGIGITGPEFADSAGPEIFCPV
jgi:hypothetical protein